MSSTSAPTHVEATATGPRLVEHWIGGSATPGSSARRSPVWNPATGERQAEVVLGAAADVDLAVQTAVKAFETWQDVPLVRRSKILFAFRELVNSHVDDLARIVTAEHGKVLSDARGEVQRGLEVVEFACGIPQLLKGEYSDQVSGGVDAYSFRQPLGAVAGITPFNFPVMVPMWMHPIAIACGNTFVLKPSERDPSASRLVAELWQRAGLPDGVFNVVHGDKEAVDALLDHPDIAAVSFVGSTPIARYVHERGSKAGKRVQALGGAKNHAVVLPDADLDFAADHITAAAYGSAGQRCMAISAVVAVGAAGDALVDKLRARAGAIQVGSGEDAGAEMGPVVTRQAQERVATYVEGGAADGASLVVDGRGLRVEGHEDGFFVGPCLLDRVTPGDEGLPGRGLRPVARRAACGHPRRRPRPRQREPLRQRHRGVHEQRRGGPDLPAQGHGRHDRHQRPDPRPDGVLQLRRVEGLTLRRPARPRTRRRRVLHPGEGRHVALAARRARVGRGVPLPQFGLTSAAVRLVRRHWWACGEIRQKLDRCVSPPKEDT